MYIRRAHIPSFLDVAPQATICHTEQNCYYIQLSSDEDEPDWYQCEDEHHALMIRSQLIKNM